MVLRLEHVHHVRPERLRRLDDVRVRRIRLAVHGERRRRAVDRDAGLDQRVDELRRGAEVRLIRRDDEAARIAQLRRRQRRVERVSRRRVRRRRLRRHHRRRDRHRPRGPIVDAAPGITAGGRSRPRRRALLHARHLVRRERPVVLAAPLDLVRAHLVDVEEHAARGSARRSRESRGWP